MCNTYIKLYNYYYYYYSILPMFSTIMVNKDV